MHAPGQSKDIPFITPDILEQYDAFLFGIPTRYGNFPAQWKTFWDSTGQKWMAGSYWGKYAGVFVSTAAPGGGQESTVIAAMSTLAHHGIVYVPLGYKYTFSLLGDLSEVRGGSPWGAGTFAVSFPLNGAQYPIPQISFIFDLSPFVSQSAAADNVIKSHPPKLIPILPQPRAATAPANPPRKSSKSPSSRAKASTRSFVAPPD